MHSSTIVNISHSATHVAKRLPLFTSNFSHPQGGFRGHPFRGSRGRFTPGGGRGYMPSNKPIFRICYKIGHTALKSFYRFDLRYQKPAQQLNRSFEAPSSAAHTTSIRNPEAFLAFPSTLNYSSWFLDSGATNHVASNDHLLESKFEYYCDAPNSAPGIKLGCLFFFFLL